MIKQIGLSLVLLNGIILIGCSDDPSSVSNTYINPSGTNKPCSHTCVSENKDANRACDQCKDKEDSHEDKND